MSAQQPDLGLATPSRGELVVKCAAAAPQAETECALEATV